MLVLWYVQVRRRDAGVVDVGWAGLLGLSALLVGLTGEGDPGRRALVGIMGGMWGLRLAAHLLTDRVWGAHEEDGRYKDLRDRLGPRVNFFHFWFFQAQAVTVVVLALPFVAACAWNSGPLGPWDYAAAALWLIALFGESLADRQLKAFKAIAANKGRVCRDGLWACSRHPNYFFEWLVWVAYALAVLAAAGPSNPEAYLGFLAPAVMLLLVLRVTGIPPTEARALRSRPEAYARYQREVSAFIPWFPQRTTTAQP
ncbi:MAG: DUF1295 domain-containing protein [Phycisphaerae bacterium]|nr:DUF1295 domain-containing protein [Phycisphaerae bacterium]